MSHSEIQGVLGHEVAHVANGDMVTMTLVQGVVNSFVLFATHIIVRILDQVLRDREGRGGLSGFMHYFAFNAISTLLSFLAYPVIAAVSRYREYRADAGGARLAGLDKMVGALKALKGTQELVDTSHMEIAAFKISGKKSKFMQLMSTHPDLDDRIRRLQMGR
jgi:heat shock protein HtpX